MVEPVNLYLIRHGKIEVTMDICYGQTDYQPASSLSTEAKRLCNILNFSEGHVYSSPLIRCQKLVKQCRIKAFIIEDRLKEINCGKWETIPWAKIDSDEFQQWEKDYINQPFPEGESYKDLFLRVSSFIIEIVDKYRFSDRNIYLFTHGGVIRAIIAYLLNLKLEDSMKIVSDYGSIAKFEITDKHIKFRGFNL